MADVNIAGMDKAAVMAALHKYSKAAGLGVLHDIGPMDVDACRMYIARYGLCTEYVGGRVMKVDLSGDTFNSWLYDRDNGRGRAQCAVDTL